MIVAVVPALNEEDSIGPVMDNIGKHVDKIIVVDDGSTDKTAEIATEKGAILVKHEQNKGLGSSLRDGFAKALEIKADVIFSIDADGQHDPSDIPKFLEEIKKGHGFVLGERDLSKYPFVKKFGNFFLNIMTNIISGTSIRDTESGFRCFSREALEKMYPYLKADRYEIAAEIIFALGYYDIDYTNVKIDSPIYVKGVTVAHGIRNFLYMLRRRKHNLRSYIEDIHYVAKKWIIRRKRH